MSPSIEKERKIIKTLKEKSRGIQREIKKNEKIFKEQEKTKEDKAKEIVMVIKGIDKLRLEKEEKVKEMEEINKDLEVVQKTMVEVKREMERATKNNENVEKMIESERIGWRIELERVKEEVRKLEKGLAKVKEGKEKIIRGLEEVVKSLRDEVREVEKEKEVLVRSISINKSREYELVVRCGEVEERVIVLMEKVKEYQEQITRRKEEINVLNNVFSSVLRNKTKREKEVQVLEKKVAIEKGRLEALKIASLQVSRRGGETKKLIEKAKEIYKKAGINLKI